MDQGKGENEKEKMTTSWKSVTKQSEDFLECCHQPAWNILAISHNDISVRKYGKTRFDFG